MRRKLRMRGFFDELAISQRWSAIFCATGAWGLRARILIKTQVFRIRHNILYKKLNSSYIFLVAIPEILLFLNSTPFLMHLFPIMSNFCSKWWVKCGNFKIVENNRLSWQRGRHLDRSLTWAASEYPSTDTSRDPFIPKDSWKRFKARQLDTVKNFIKLITLLVRNVTVW